jgi:hypothetical protein
MPHMIPNDQSDALVTIFRSHFGTPPETPHTVYVNKVELAQLTPGKSCPWLAPRNLIQVL